MCVNIYSIFIYILRMGGKFEREKDGERVETARTFDINVEWGRAGDSGSGLLLRQQMFFKTN